MYCIPGSPQPVMSQPYPVPIPLPQPKSRPLPDSRGIPDTLNLTYCNPLCPDTSPDESRIICDIDWGEVANNLTSTTTYSIYSTPLLFYSILTHITSFAKSHYLTIFGIIKSCTSYSKNKPHTHTHTSNTMSKSL